MALVHEFEKTGNWLFKRRSWLPLFLVVAGLIVMYFDDSQKIFFNPKAELLFLGISLFGEAIRIIAVGFAAKNTSGRNTVQGQIADDLNVTGIYSLMRHPLYFGNFFMWLGPALFIRSWQFVVIFILLYWLYYERIMFAEEQFLRRKFGDIYDRWSDKVRAVIPVFKGFIPPELPFSVKDVLKREYNSFVNIFLIFLILDLFRNYCITDSVYLTPLWLYISLPAGLIWLVVRILHKKTRCLEER